MKKQQSVSRVNGIIRSIPFKLMKRLVLLFSKTWNALLFAKNTLLVIPFTDETDFWVSSKSWTLSFIRFYRLVLTVESAATCGIN